jgi:threonine dehydrogenase-like Zn-dependent dehydrogenase
MIAPSGFLVQDAALERHRHRLRAIVHAESGKLDVRPLVTHTLPLQEFEKAFDLLSNRPEPVVKVMLKP